jgi:CheY-like chemotaxis protein
MNPLSILVADDTPETLEVISFCLRNCGHAVLCARGGREAITLLQDRNFDLVITDLLMPDADGMEVIMAVREHQPSASIIAMSGGGEFFSSRHLLNLAASLGADEKLTKPFSRDVLLAAVDRASGANRVLAGAA